MTMRIHLRLDHVDNSHIRETLFFDGANAGSLTMDHGQYQVFGAALLLGAKQMHGDLKIEIDPIAHDKDGNFIMPPSSSNNDQGRYHMANNTPQRMSDKRLNFLLTKSIPSVSSRKHRGWLIELAKAVEAERAIVERMNECPRKLYVGSSSSQDYEFVLVSDLNKAQHPTPQEPKNGN